MSDKTITLSNKEFVFLAALLGEAVVLGVDDPFLGWLAEQVEEEWMRLSPGMFENGLIYIGVTGSYEVSPEINKFIRLCCTPDIWASVTIVKQKEGNSSFVLNLGTGDKKAVKVIKKQMNESVELCCGGYEQKESVEVYNSLGIGNSFKNNGAGFDIPEKIFKSLTESSVEEGVIRLNDIIQDNKIEIENFVKDIKAPKAKSLINIGSMKVNSSGMTSFILIEGENSLWRVEYYDERECPMVSVRQSDSADCIDKLERSLKMLG